MAASLALTGGACTRAPEARIHAWVDLPEARGGGLPLYYASAFIRDGFAHGVLIGTREGRPIKIEGNTLHPESQGSTNSFMQAAILGMYDPDRSQNVFFEEEIATWE
ncbi:MAG: molybdopterin oxidoreductase, partial [Pseudomonadota bacterium]|nr:molybdopterin oxidoreductase [Pseudomonadota bacterium]